MKPKALLLCLLVICLSSQAQIFDDFSDGDFTENPSWHGSDSIFIINENLQLQLNANVSGKAWLSCEYDKKNEMEWRFWIRENFSPSNNNFTDIYIYSDNTNINDAEKAFILRFGEAGSNDVMEFLKKDNDNITSLCRGTDTFIASPFSAFIKITYDESGSWKFFVDKEGNNAYALEMECNDNSFNNLNNIAHFGILCTFTNSNTKRFYFDDIYAGDKIIDSIAPELTAYKVVDEFHLELYFSEALNEETALDIYNYSVDNQINTPIKVSFRNNLSSLILQFDKALQEGLIYNLSIRETKDLSGNVAEKLSCEFFFYYHKENDIVINEVMSDPEPAVDLPAYEYVEIYNTTDFPIKMKGWSLVLGNSEHKITEDIDIQAKEYMILCHDDAKEAFSTYGKCHSFSSFQISNSGAYIALIDSTKAIVSELDFDISWHDDSYKEEGGWSLEQIDSGNPCAGKPNWGSSKCGAGGTPAAINSIAGNNAIRPKLEHINIINNNIIELFFDQKMNVERLQNIDNYFITEIQSHPSETYLLPNKNDYVELIFDNPFEEDRIYTIEINDVYNCKDVSPENMITANFGIPKTAEYNDLIINEILFNPISPGADYVEIYNKSDKVIDLSKLLLGSINESFPNPPDTILKEICPESRIILPKSYMLLSTDSEIIKYQYDSKSDNFIDMESFPSMPNDEGRVIICNRAKTIIDEMYYSDKMHYDLLVETKGVALERISFDNPSSDINNWHSASYNVNYGTPGYKNSMAVDYTENENENENEIIITPEIFSPDGDGFDDICSIHYNFEKNGYSMNINIFNSKGILIKNLLKNNLVDAEGFVTWNGCDDNNNVVSQGIYIVKTEIFDTKGFVKELKNVVVVAKKR